MALFHFFFMTEWCSVTYTCRVFFTQSSVDGHSGCFPVLAIVNRAAVSVRIHVSFGIMVFSGYIPSGGIAGMKINKGNLI